MYVDRLREATEDLCDMVSWVGGLAVRLRIAAGRLEQAADVDDMADFQRAHAQADNLRQLVERLEELESHAGAIGELATLASRGEGQGFSNRTVEEMAAALAAGE